MDMQRPEEEESNYPRRVGDLLPGNHPYNLLLLQKVGFANAAVAILFQLLWVLRYVGVIENVFATYIWLCPLAIVLVGSIPIIGLARDGRWSLWKTTGALCTPLADYFPLAGLLMITATQDTVVEEAKRFGVRRRGRWLRAEDFAHPELPLSLDPAIDNYE
jgi:hypothetical protein